MSETLLKPVADLTPGDEVARDILVGAQVLLRQGTVLTESHIDRLNRLNLSSITVLAAKAPVPLPSFVNLANDDEPSWISDGQFSSPVPTQAHTISERMFSEQKSVLRQQAGLQPLIDPVRDEELTRKLEAAFIQSAVQKQVFLERIEKLANDLSGAINLEGEYLDLTFDSRYLPFNDIVRHGQHLIASCMQAAKMYRQLVRELPDALYETQVKAHLALSNIFVLLPSHYYTHSITAHGDAPPLEEAVNRYVFWLADQDFVPAEVLDAAQQRLLCQHHPDPTASHSCAQLPSDAQRLGVAGFYCQRLYSLPNRPRLAPHDAAQQVVQQAERLFASKEANLFLQRVGYFPLGSLVELSNGTIALVVKQNQNALLKPVVQLVTSEGELDGEYDLMQTRDIYIRRQVLEY